MPRYVGTSDYGKVMPLEERYKEMVRRGDNTESCWLWKGIRKSSRQYPEFKINGRIIKVHRWAYGHFVKPIPEGLVVDHLCNSRMCCNPWHLEPKTTRENTMRGVSFSRINAEKTHCKHGHPFNEENTRYRKSPTSDRLTRVCWPCSLLTHIEIKRRYRARQRAKGLPAY